MDYLKNHIKVSDLSSIVEQYLMGKDNLSAKDKNKNANLLGVDLFIARPILKQLCRGGHILLVKKYIDYVSINKPDINRNIIINKGLKEACYKGYLEVTKYLIDQGANDFNDGMSIACRYGHLEVTKYLIDQGANDFNEGLACACSYGHLEVTKYLIDQGANNLNEGLIYACSYGHLKVTKYLIDQGANNLNEGLIYAYRCDHLELVEYLVECKKKSNTMLYLYRYINKARRWRNLIIAKFFKK